MDGGGHVPGVKTPGLVDARNAQAEAWAYLRSNGKSKGKSKGNGMGKRRTDLVSCL